MINKNKFQSILKKLKEFEYEKSLNNKEYINCIFLYFLEDAISGYTTDLREKTLILNEYLLTKGTNLKIQNSNGNRYYTINGAQFLSPVDGFHRIVSGFVFKQVVVNGVGINEIYLLIYGLFKEWKLIDGRNDKPNTEGLRIYKELEKHYLEKEYFNVFSMKLLGRVKRLMALEDICFQAKANGIDQVIEVLKKHKVLDAEVDYSSDFNVLVPRYDHNSLLTEFSLVSDDYSYLRVSYRYERASGSGTDYVIWSFKEAQVYSYHFINGLITQWVSEWTGHGKIIVKSIEVGAGQETAQFVDALLPYFENKEYAF